MYYLVGFFEKMELDKVYEGYNLLKTARRESLPNFTGVRTLPESCLSPEKFDAEGVAIVGMVKMVWKVDRDPDKVWDGLNGRTKEEKTRRKIWRWACRIWFGIPRDKRRSELLAIVVEGIRRGSVLHARERGEMRQADLENQLESFNLRLDRILEEDEGIISDEVLYKIVSIYCNISAYDDANIMMSR